jgi:hypothetical protein
MLRRQGGGCALCGRKPQHGKSLMVDHNHKTGKPRGLLCIRCNWGIGHFRDNPILMRLGAKYVAQDLKADGWL